MNKMKKFYFQKFYFISKLNKEQIHLILRNTHYFVFNLKILSLLFVNKIKTAK